MKKIRQIIGSLQDDEKEVLHWDVEGSECSEQDVDCVFYPNPDMCTNCGGSTSNDDSE